MAKRGERGIYTMECAMIQSCRMTRLLNKLSERYSRPFDRPQPRPVIINNRLKSYGGMAYPDRMEISGDTYREYQTYHQKKNLRNLVWHETLHYVVRDNYIKIRGPQQGDAAAHDELEKLVFALGLNDGSHNSWTWKLVCSCGWWHKRNQKVHKVFCGKCQRFVVSPTEYAKLVRVAQLKSEVMPCDITRYVVWKENKRIIGE